MLVQMITREQGSDDVHELYLSKEGFDKKARERVPVYTGEILNRPPGDAGHIGHSGPSTSHLKKLIKSEATRPHFTAVVVTGTHVVPFSVHFLNGILLMWMLAMIRMRSFAQSSSGRFTFSLHCTFEPRDVIHFRLGTELP